MVHLINILTWRQLVHERHGLSNCIALKFNFRSCWNPQSGTELRFSGPVCNKLQRYGLLRRILRSVSCLYSRWDPPGFGRQEILSSKMHRGELSAFDLKSTMIFLVPATFREGLLPTHTLQLFHLHSAVITDESRCCFIPCKVDEPLCAGCAGASAFLCKHIEVASVRIALEIGVERVSLTIPSANSLLHSIAFQRQQQQNRGARGNLAEETGR